MKTNVQDFNISLYKVYTIWSQFLVHKLRFLTAKTNPYLVRFGQFLRDLQPKQIFRQIIFKLSDGNNINNGLRKEQSFYSGHQNYKSNTENKNRITLQMHLIKTVIGVIFSFQILASVQCNYIYCHETELNFFNYLPLTLHY